MINKAIELAIENDELFKLGAVVTDRKRRVISFAQNQMSKTHPVQKRWSNRVSNGKQIYLHAEIGALIKLRGNRQPYAIYVARVFKDDDNTPALARPCPVCMAAIKAAGIKRVYYTIAENEIGVIKL